MGAGVPPTVAICSFRKPLCSNGTYQKQTQGRPPTPCTPRRVQWVLFPYRCVPARAQCPFWGPAQALTSSSASGPVAETDSLQGQWKPALRDHSLHHVSKTHTPEWDSPRSGTTHTLGELSVVPHALPANTRRAVTLPGHRGHKGDTAGHLVGMTRGQKGCGVEGRHGSPLTCSQTSQESRAAVQASPRKHWAASVPRDSCLRGYYKLCLAAELEMEDSMEGIQRTSNSYNQ